MPNQWPRRSAVSAVMPRSPLMNSGDPIDRHVNLPCQLRCRNVEFSQLFGKMLAGVNRGARHGMSHLVVINDLDIDWAGRSFGPFEANPPLVVDADTVLSLPITIEGLKTIAAKRA